MSQGISQENSEVSQSPLGSLVSICIPVYNHEKYVEQCVRSVIAQDYQRVELIIIDDGSTDASADVVGHLSDLCAKRFERFAFVSRPNRGLSATLNEGLKWSRGEYFCVIASDDAMLPRKTSILLSHLQSVSSCAGAFGGIQIMDDDGEIVGRLNPKARSCDFKDVFLAKVKLLAPANLLRTKIVRQIGGFNESVKVEDWDMWLRMTSRGESLQIIGEEVSLYRRHHTNTSKNYELMQAEMAKIAADYQQHPLFKANQAMLLCLKFRDRAIVSKIRALKMLPTVIWRVSDVRMYQGLFNLLFKW